MSETFEKLKIAELRNLVVKKEVKVSEVISHYLDKIVADKSNSFLQICKDSALEEAKKQDNGNVENLKLAGVALGVKDVFCTKGVTTTSGSKMLANFVPTYESTVTERLFNAGAINVGKLNMDEFAMGSTGKNSAFGPSISPFRDATQPDIELTPGGSSSGSAVAVAANLCHASLGSDTGGSIRQPAAFCGIVGVKPSYGLCSRYGMVAYASSLDQAGVFTRNVEDAAIITEEMWGADGKDSTLSNRPKIKLDLNWKDMPKKLGRKIRIGVPKEYEVDGIHADIIKKWHESVEALEKTGLFEIQSISLPYTQYAINVYYIISTAEASSNLARYDGVRYGHRSSEEFSSLDDMYLKTRSEGFGKEVKRRIILGGFVLSAGSYEEYYLRALKVRRLVKEDFNQAFAKVDAIICPVTPNLSYPLKENCSNPLTTYVNDILTVPANLAGLCGITVPVGTSSLEKLPIGMQILANQFDDEKMFNIAAALEEVI